MRVLVTGGAGFIGSHVVDALVARGNEVRVLDAALPAAHNGVPGYVSPDAEVIWGDLTDLETVTQAVAGVDAVSHQAAMVGLGEGSADGPAYVINNDLGTAVLLQALAATSFAGRFVLASSMVVYGEGSYSCPEHGLVRPGPRERADLDSGMFEARCPRCGRPALPVPIDESGPLDPRNVYAATKVHQEHLCSIFARETGASLVALRYHNVYGPRMPRDTPYAGVASIFRSALGRGDPP
ncbi:MAG: NAD-dependent epimerase/dehydratase family protein, partial [Actinomycetota bacterium]